MPARVPTNTASSTGRAVRSVPVVLDQLPDGKVRVSTPLARGFAAVVRGPHETWHALRQVLIEAQCAGYAEWHGARYDQDAMTLPDEPGIPPQRTLVRQGRNGVSYARTAACRPDQAHPSDWSPNPDGTWTSPRGRVYRDQGFIERLVEKRAALGLPTAHTERRTA